MSNTDKLRQQLLLAALLHDIGKFYQSAEPQKYKKDEVFTHTHDKYTFQFYEDYEIVREVLSKFNKIENFPEEITVIKMAAHHHKTFNDWEQIIREGDNLSAGIDRIRKNNITFDDIDNEILEKLNPFSDRPNRPLLSIFSRIKLNYEKKAEYAKFLRVDKLTLDQIFPEELNENLCDNYNTLWKEFIEELGKLKNIGDIKAFNETFLKLLEKYTTKITSSADKNQFPDITLYDHARTTAAFAIAIFNYFHENNIELSLENEPYRVNTLIKDKKAFLLVGGDLSGIQNFIYDIKGKYAAKTLKGRSFFLHLLVKSFVKKLIEKLNLTKANIVYAAGGSFYLIAQNTDKTKQEIERLTALLNKALYNIFGLSLYLAVDYIEFGHEDIGQGNQPNRIGQLWKTLINEKIELKKQQRYVDIIDKLFDIRPIVNNKHDGITGEYIRDYKCKIIDNTHVKKINEDLRELGQKLRDCKYWIISDKKLTDLSVYGFEPFNIDYFPPKTNINEFSDLMVYHYFIPHNNNDNNNNDAILLNLQGVEINVLNEFNFLPKDVKDNSYGFEFYGGNLFPTYTKEEINKLKEKYEREGRNFNKKEGDIKEFEHLAQGENFNRLGVLRMDVDNLGSIFSTGLPENQLYFSRIATLSRSLDLFFSGYLNKIWEKDKYKQNTMIVYSGGDDLFIVGRWDLVLDMAYEIREDFRKYTCGNPNLSISGGVEIVDAKFPILKAAILSGEKEEAAKKRKLIFHKKEDGQNTETLIVEKNSFCFFNVAFNWDVDINIVKDLKNKIFEFITWEDKERLPNRFIQTIINFNKLRLEAEKKQKNPDWLWQILYYLKRIKVNYLKLSNFIDKTAEIINTHKTKNMILPKFYDEISLKILQNNSYIIPSYLKNYCLENNFHFLDLLTVACKWAELEKRTKIKNL